MNCAQYQSKFVRQIFNCWKHAILTVLFGYLAPSRALGEEMAEVQTTTKTGYVLSIDGQVTMKNADLPEETPIIPAELKSGDLLRTEIDSRATGEFLDKSSFTLRERTILYIEPQTHVNGVIKAHLKEGAMFYSRRKGIHEVNVSTPHGRVLAKGTEYLISVDSAAGLTRVVMFDGEVELIRDEDAAPVSVHSGQFGVVRPGQPIEVQPILKATNIVQWWLYYPAVLAVADLSFDPATNERLTNSLAFYRAGDLRQALKSFPGYPGSARPNPGSESAYFAGLLLANNGIEQAMEWVKVGSPDDPRYRALRIMIDAVTMSPCAATNLLLLKTPSSQKELTASEWLAMSYLQQAILPGAERLDAALASARRSVTISPDFGYGWARVAELEFSHGNTRSAKQAVANALRYSPKHAPAQAMQGFILAAENHPAQAKAAFEQAIQCDPKLANGWLGRGLCRIRQGDLAGGRQDLTVAAASEPQRSLLRSYLGKAFSEEKDWDKALHELKLAMTLDPDDPTSWLYSALLKQNLNRGNEAIADLEQSKKLNANRQIYRSQLLLDQDQAVRSANLAGMYQDAGLQETAVNEASRAVNSDYANASAHAFLANAYDGMRDPGLVNLRYETPWNSELLLANLLAPPGVGVLSQNISQQEYSRMFDANHAGLISSTEYRSQGDWIHSSSQYGRYDNMSYSVGVDYRDENGQRPNQERQLTYLTASAKIQITPSDSLLLMASTFDSQAGDLGQYYDPAMARPRLQVKETQEPSVFLGYHREFTPQSHTLLLIGRVEDSLQLSDPDAAAKLVFRDVRGVISNVVPYPNDSDTNSFNLNYRREKTIWSSELQQLWLSGSHTIIAGMRYQQSAQDVHSSLEITDTPRFKNDIPYAQSETTGFYRISPYLYEQWQWNSLRAFAGLSYDQLHYPENIDLPPITSRELTQDQFSPKAGLEWSIEANTTARLAWTRSLGGQYDDQSYRLEPSQVAGITQSYRSMIPESYSGNAAGLIPGARFETWGAGLDHRFPTRTYLTLHAEHLREDGDREIGAFKYSRPYVTNFDSLNQQIQYRESSMVVALNQLVGRDWSFGLRYQVSQAELECQFPSISTAVQKKALANQNLPLNEQDRALLHEVRLDAIWNDPSGFFWRGGAHWHAQDNAQDMAWMKNDSFWQLDTYLGYRFLQRRASVQAGLLNILDQDYRLNPFNLMRELPRRRTLTVQVRIDL